MRKNITRAAALTMTVSMLLAQAAYADNTTTTSQAPGSGSTSTTTTQSSTTSSSALVTPGTSNVTTTDQTTTASSGSTDTSNAGIISQTGPTGTKQLDDKGYLVIGAGVGSNSTGTRVIGPGSDSSTSSANTANQSSQTAGSQTVNVQSVTIDQSVEKPSISAEAAVLYDATTKQVLFEKNSTKAMSPASTTKLLTGLLAAEKLDMNDTFTFSSSAVNNLESGAVTAGMKTGDTMKVEDAMYAMLLRSACEVANGLAEKVSGSQSAFAELMNQRAKELGCTGSNFVNASGLNSDQHYTTAYDMALITAAALDNDTVKKVLQTGSYTLPATKNRSALTIKTSNKMAAGGTESYAGYVGGKTGYTSKAGSCLAGEIEYNGHKVIAVVFKDNTNQYKDSKALFDYALKLIGGSNASAGTAAATGSSTAQTTAPTTTQSTASTAAASSSSNASGKWVDAGNGKKKYQKADGSYYTNAWLDLDGKTYFFGSDSIMCTGWKQFTNSDWYYFNPQDGSMVAGKWVTQNGKSYYLQQNGTMAKSKVIDNKYRVDANGVYVEKVG